MTSAACELNILFCLIFSSFKCRQPEVTKATIEQRLWIFSALTEDNVAVLIEKAYIR